MNQVRAGAVLNYIIIFLNIGTGVLYTPFMLRCLGQTEYGLYSLVASVIAYLSLLDFGFSASVTRYISKIKATEGKESEWSLYGMFMGIYIVIGIIAGLGGLILYANVDNMFDQSMTMDEIRQAKIMMSIMTLNLVLSFPFSIFYAIIASYEKFVFARTCSIIRIILTTLVLVAVLLLGYKAIALVIVQTIFNLLNLAVNAIYCKWKLRIKIRFSNFNYLLLKEITVFSLWNFLGAIVDRIYWGTGQFVLGIMNGPVAVAVFSLAISLSSMYISMSTSINSVLLPRLTTLAVKRDSDRELSDIFLRTSRLQFIVMSLILSGFVIFGKPFIILWSGPDYISTYYISLIFFSFLLCPLIQNVGLSILVARGQLQFRTICYVCIAVVSLLGQIAFTKHYGALGCAWVIGLSIFAGQWIAMNIYYYKKQRLDIPDFWQQIGKMSIIPVLLSLVGILIIKVIHINFDNWFNLILGILIYMIVFFPLMWKFSMGKYEKNQIISLLNAWGLKMLKI